MLVTFFVMLVIFPMYQIGHQHPESVTNISNLSPTHLVSNIRHQHRCNRLIDIFKVTASTYLRKFMKRYNLNVFQENSSRRNCTYLCSRSVSVFSNKSPSFWIFGLRSVGWNATFIISEANFDTFFALRVIFGYS